MKINFSNARLADQAWSADSLPKDESGFEIAFAGRSNVGKSSLLNRIVNRKNLARVSKTPGRTRQAYFYELAPSRTLIDLPGYGYAKGARGESEVWGEIVAGVLSRKSLKALIWLLDARHAPVKADEMMKPWLEEYAGGWVRIIPVLTKCDKISTTHTQQACSRVNKWLAGDPRYDKALTVSSLKKTGLDALIKRISGYLNS